MKNSKLVLFVVMVFVFAAFAQSMIVDDAASPSTGTLYKNAYWQCYDGSVSNQVTECKSYSNWFAQASEYCKRRCSAERCGVAGFKVSNVCSSTSCSDSDGGKNYNVKGTTSGPNNPSATDFCITYSYVGVLNYETMKSKGGTSGLIEHYCDQYGYVANQPYPCP